MEEHLSQSVDRRFGGTLPYMAPEQLQGHPCIESDQYALAIVIYEWLVGHRPFRGTKVETIAQHISPPPPSLILQVTGLASSVETVLFQALAKQPSDRFESVQAFDEGLQHASQSSHLPEPENQPLPPVLVRETPQPTTPLLAKDTPTILPSPVASEDFFLNACTRCG